jgi:hypothetical protein
MTHLPVHDTSRQWVASVSDDLCLSLVAGEYLGFKRVQGAFVSW